MRSSQTHRTGVVAAVAVGVATALLVPVAPAASETATLCSGYQRCAQTGKNSRGYVQARDRSYWRMYSGHNCTNYVAYRLVRNGLPNQRPWSGPGDATHWGTALAGRTDQRPAVGSVAWWKAGTSRGGRTGHVAYVERVVSGSEIVVSQDSWSGDFSWARISRSRGWPSGFIHLKDAPLRPLAAPRVSGSPRVGQRLVASGGSWAPTPTSVSYRWSVGGRPVRGAGSRTLLLRRHMIGERVQVRVTATRLGYPRTVASSRATAVVGSGRLGLSRRPTLDGHSRLTRTLRVSPGGTAPRAQVVRYRWLRDGRPVRGAHGRTYRVRRADLGSRVRAQVVYRRQGYDARSALTRATRRITTTPRVTVTARPGRGVVRLTVTGRATGRPLSSMVVVKRGSRVLDRATMRRGTAVLHLDGVRAGRRAIRVRVNATETTGTYVMRRTVRFRR